MQYCACMLTFSLTAWDTKDTTVPVLTCSVSVLDYVCDHVVDMTFDLAEFNYVLAKAHVLSIHAFIHCF